METAPPVPREVESLLRALPGHCRARFFGDDGSIQWTFGSWSAAEGEVAAAAAAASNARGAAPPASTQLLGEGQTLYRATIATGGSEARAATLIVVAHSEPDDGLSAAIDALASMVAMIGSLNAELDAMAVELSDRYEELNLVFATSRQASRAHDVRTGLEDLVRHCHEHLGSSVAALVLPRQHITIERHDDRAPLRDVHEFLQAAAGQFLDRMASTGRPIVCNDDLSDAGSLAAFGHFKMAAMPVRNGRDAICGVLMMVNGQDAPDFRNSDRNLLASIAEKAAKLIERSFDPLTGLPSRWEFEQRIDALLARDRDAQAEHALLWIDVDELRVLNETLGMAAGDAVMRTVARHLDAQQRAGGLLARLDADEFGLVLESCSAASARAVAETLCESVRKLQLTFDGQTIAITASIGVATIDGQTVNAAAALHAAEVASAAAHESGRDRVHVYQEHADTLVQRGEQMRWVGRIHNALRKDRFRLFGQLIQPLNGRAEQHVEVLLRLVDDDDVMQGPSSFVPAAERFFLMPGIDRWVITHVLALMRTRPLHELPLCSINLSGQSNSDESFLEFILAELAASAVPCERICFEITETAAIKSLEDARQFMLQVKRRGCHFSLDDFGTGLSSFSYLKALPFDFVKIDGSFVRGILEDRVSESMVKAITEVGHAMGLGIIAEYVENAAIRDKLKKIDVDFGQGYAIERPIPLTEHFARRARNEAVNA
jgi:diguanylate cyclase (GGDEF)-like protein